MADAKKENFPEKIKNWRAANNMTQKAAAIFFGISTRAYQFWESGKYEPDDHPCMNCVEAKMKTVTPPVAAPAG